MNCRPGDLAIILRAVLPEAKQHIGKVVRVARLSLIFSNHWRLERDFVCSDGSVMSWPDADLRPIRDSDGEDEMLRIAGKPQEVNA